MNCSPVSASRTALATKMALVWADICGASDASSVVLPTRLSLTASLTAAICGMVKARSD
jgi:hypothetical protein